MIKVVEYIDNENLKIHVKVYDIVAEEPQNSADTIAVRVINNGSIAVKRIPHSKWNRRNLIREEILSDM